MNWRVPSRTGEENAESVPAETVRARAVALWMGRRSGWNLFSRLRRGDVGIGYRMVADDASMRRWRLRQL